MAIVYSLICFGGRSGKTVTMTSATPCLLSLTKHGLRDGTGVVITTSGSLYTGITAGTTYYARWVSIDTFHLYDTQAHAIAGGSTGRVNTSGSQSGTHTIKSDYWVNTLDATAKLRYGSAGSERAYDSLAAWHSGRSAAAAIDTEVCEIGMAWTDFLTNTANNPALTVNLPCSTVLITPTREGVYTDAYHNGRVSVPGGALYGYAFTHTVYYCDGALKITGPRVTVEGITGLTSQVSGQEQNSTLFWQEGAYSAFKNCIAVGLGASATGARCGFYGRGNAFEISNCIAVGFTGTGSMGFQMYDYFNAYAMWANNLAVKSEVGFKTSNNVSQSPTSGLWFYNNIAVGNTTNWSTFTATTWYQAGYNCGESGNTPWYKTTDTGIKTMTTSHFVDYANNDFRPANASAPQVDAAVTIATITAEDIKHAERPNYNNGGAEAWDCGPFEFDHGYTRPVQRDLVFTGAQDGSQIIVYTTSTTTELQRNDSTSGDETYEANAAGVTVDYTIYKLGYDPIRVTGVALDAETTTITVQQTVNRAWVASSGLTYTTDLTYTAGTPNILKLRIASTLQNALCCLYEAFIASATNTALKNRAFPAITNGPNSFSLIDTEWRGWSTTGTATANTSLDLLKRDGMRYITAGGTVNATWGAFYTPDTGAGLQVKYRQATAGSIVSALTTGPIDQLIQIQGGASYGAFDYTGHMVMRAPKVGYSQPKPNFVSIYGTLEDQLYVSGLAPVLQWATTNADIDAANLVLDNTAKTYVVSAAHSVAELYQRAQWWANQDAQWDADIPLTSVDGNTYTLATGWTLSGLAYVTGAQTIAGGTITLGGPGTYAPAFSGNTVVAQGEGTYTFTAAATIITFAPTANAVTYVLGSGTFSGTIDLRNTHATRAITVELPSGTSYTTANNTGAAITVTLPQVYQSVAITGIAANYRVQIYDGSVSAPVGSRELYNAVPGATSVTWTDPLPAAANRLIRLRVTADDPDPGEAIVMIDQTIGTCGTSSGSSAVSYLVTEAEDEVYTQNNVEGSTVTGITIDDGALLLEIDSGTVVTYGGVDVIEVDVKDIYAYETYWLGTEGGIRDEARFIDAIDGANYEFNDFKLKNTSDPVMPILIVGGYVRDAATGVAASLVDYSGGPIHFAPDHVVNNIVTVGGANIITGDIADLSIPTASQNAAATIAAAEATPIRADLRKVLGEVFDGTGTEADPWGPV